MRSVWLNSMGLLVSVPSHSSCLLELQVNNSYINKLINHSNKYLIFFTGIVFWVLGASLVLITAHAAFYNYDALDVAEDQEQLVGTIVEEV